MQKPNKNEEVDIKNVFQQILFALKTIEGHVDALNTENKLNDEPVNSEIKNNTISKTETAFISNIFPFIFEKVQKNELPTEYSIQKTIEVCKQIYANINNE